MKYDLGGFHHEQLHQEAVKCGLCERKYQGFLGLFHSRGGIFSMNNFTKKR
jgi:hypothetical protein